MNNEEYVYDLNHYECAKFINLQVDLVILGLVIPLCLVVNFYPSMHVIFLFSILVGFVSGIKTSCIDKNRKFLGALCDYSRVDRELEAKRRAVYAGYIGLGSVWLYFSLTAILSGLQ